MTQCNQKLFRYQATLFVVLFVSLFASNAYAENVTGVFRRVTTMEEVTTGDYVIIGQQKQDGFGLLTYTELNKGRIPYSQAYTSAPESVINPNDVSVWHINIIYKPSVTIYYDASEYVQYLADGGSGKLKYDVSSGIVYYTLACNDNGVFALTTKDTNKNVYALCIYTVSNCWGNYSPASGYNNGYCLYLYKKSDEKPPVTQQFTVQWYVDGEVVKMDTYDEGTSLALPEGVNPSEACEGKTFVGWTDVPVPVMTDTRPSTLFTEATGIVTEDKSYYAVFAEVDEGPTSTSYTGYTTACSGGVIRDNLIFGDFGTICMPQKMVGVTGADFYSISHKEMNGNTVSSLVLEEVTEFEAGTPYLFKATASTIMGELQGETCPAKSVNGLVGVDEETLLDAVEQYNDERNFYLIYDNKICLAQGYCGVHAHYAYIRMDDVPVEPIEPVTSVRRVSMAVEQPEVVTVLPKTENRVATPQKVIEHGRLYIYYDGVKRDAQGRVILGL